MFFYPSIGSGFVCFRQKSWPGPNKTSQEDLSARAQGADERASRAGRG